MSSKHLLTPQFTQQLLAAMAHPLVWVAFVLLAFNWSLEAWKWKILASRIEPISFFEALSGVFTGVCFGMVTPHGIGDYAGRVFQLNTSVRLQAIGAVFVSRIAQLLITVLVGSGVLLYMLFYFKILPYVLLNYTLMVFVSLTNIAFLFLFFQYKRICKIFKNRYTKIFLKSILRTDHRQMWVVLGLSSLRYGVFATQYIFLLYYVGIPCTVPVLAAGVAFVFIVKSIIPTFFDIGIREAAAIYFFSAYAANADSVVFASVLLWLINIVLPAVIGALMIFRIRVFS